MLSRSGEFFPLGVLEILGALFFVVTVMQPFLVYHSCIQSLPREGQPDCASFRASQCVLPSFARHVQQTHCDTCMVSHPWRGHLFTLVALLDHTSTMFITSADAGAWRQMQADEAYARIVAAAASRRPIARMD